MAIVHTPALRQTQRLLLEGARPRPALAKWRSGGQAAPHGPLTAMESLKSHKASVTVVAVESTRQVKDLAAVRATLSCTSSCA